MKRVLVAVIIACVVLTFAFAPAVHAQMPVVWRLIAIGGNSIGFVSVQVSPPGPTATNAYEGGFTSQSACERWRAALVKLLSYVQISVDTNYEGGLTLTPDAFECRTL